MPPTLSGSLYTNLILNQSLNPHLTCATNTVSHLQNCVLYTHKSPTFVWMERSSLHYVNIILKSIWISKSKLVKTFKIIQSLFFTCIPSLNQPYKMSDLNCKWTVSHKHAHSHHLLMHECIHICRCTHARALMHACAHAHTHEHTHTQTQEVATLSSIFLINTSKYGVFQLTFEIQEQSLFQHVFIRKRGGGEETEASFCPQIHVDKHQRQGAVAIFRSGGASKWRIAFHQGWIN